MNFSWWTFALQAVNFLILVWLLRRFLFKPVSCDRRPAQGGDCARHGGSVG